MTRQKKKEEIDPTAAAVLLPPFSEARWMLSLIMVLSKSESRM